MSEEKKVKLSVAIITFNEEKNIERCLNSIKDLADEITIVDSLSTDNTVAICEKFGANIYPQKFLGHVEQKNFALTKTKFQHVLSLDADEALDPMLQNRILKIKENWQSDGYSMNRLTNYCGQWIHHCGWYPDTKVRLFNKEKGQWKGVNPHDEFFLKNEATLVHLKANILHYSYNSINDHIKQVNYFTDILAKSSLQKGKRSSLFKIIFSPLFKFFRDYLFKLGVLDGYYGFIICMISSHATFLKYVKMRQFNKTDWKDAYTSE